MAMYDLEMMDLGLEPEDFALEERHEEEPEGPEDIGDWIVRVTSSWPYTNVPAPHVHCVVGGEEASDRCALAAEEEHDRAALPRALVSDWEASRRCAVWAEEQEELVSLLRAQPVPLKARMIHRRLMRVRMVPGSGAPSPVKWPQPQGPEGGMPRRRVLGSGLLGGLPCCATAVREPNNRRQLAHNRRRLAHNRRPRAQQPPSVGSPPPSMSPTTAVGWHTTAVGWHTTAVHEPNNRRRLAHNRRGLAHNRRPRAPQPLLLGSQPLSVSTEPPSLGSKPSD